MKIRAVIILISAGISISLLIPHGGVNAQEGCFDATGGSIPCPATEEPQTDEPTRKPPTPIVIPITSTFTATATSTFTLIPTFTPSPTPSITPTVTQIPPTYTPTITPTATPLPPQGAAMWMPGIGIGAFILLIVVGILLPAVQKIRISQRE